MGKKYCEICKKKCKSYAVRIDENIYVHRDCFKCSECKEELELSKFYFKNTCLYCIKDFKRLYYPKCTKCAQIIEDEMVKVMDKTYHLNCLCCSFCRATLKHGDKLNFDGKNLICRQCTLISIRVQSINKASLKNSNGTLNSTQTGNSPNNQASSDYNIASSPKVDDGKKELDSVANPKTPLFSPTGKPPPFPSKRPASKANSEVAVSSYKPALGHSKNFPSERSPRSTSPRSISPRSDRGGLHLERPSSFRRGPSFNVSHRAADVVRHFHVPGRGTDDPERFSRSGTLPKGGGRSSTSPAAASATHQAAPSVSETKAPTPLRSLAQSTKNEDITVSRDTLSKTPLAGISEDGMSVQSHASCHLPPPRGYALKPGYGLKPIVYAFCGASPDAKQHLYSGAVSVEDSKDTKSVSLGSDCYSSFYSVEEEEKLDPYTGLKRNRSIRSTISHDPRLNRPRTLMEVVSSKRPITVSQFLKRVDQATEESRRNAKKHSIENLRSILSSPEGRLMNKDRLEDYLLDEEFKNLFSMERIQFQQLPEWKKADLKRKHHLC